MKKRNIRFICASKIVFIILLCCFIANNKTILAKSASEATILEEAKPKVTVEITLEGEKVVAVKLNGTNLTISKSKDATTGNITETIVINNKTITLVSKNSIAKKAAQEVVQEALKLGEEGKNTLHVKINGKGKIRLVQKATPLYIYNNTALILENTVTVLAEKDVGPMLTTISESKLSADDEDENNEGKKYPEYPGYTAWNNIAIKGGIWDAGGKTGQAFKFRHGQNLKIQDLTAQHSTGHTINISASQNVKILNVTIKDSYTEDITANRNDPTNIKKFKPFTNREVIHLDYAGSGEGIYQDGTAVNNVLIKNCIFENVPCAIGNHVPAKKITDSNKVTYPKETSYGKNITIQDCTFKNISNYAINLYSHKNVTIKGNTCSGTVKGLAFIRYYDTTIKSSTKVNTDNKNVAKMFNKESILMNSIGTITASNMAYKNGEAIFPEIKSEGTLLTLRKRLCFKKH